MTEWIQDFMREFSYPAVGLLMLAENVFPPIPSELILPFAGYICAQGDLNVFGVLTAGTVGSVAGGLPFYYAGKSLGRHRLRSWVERHGHWLALSVDDYDRALDWFEKNGEKAVVVCRLVPGIRSLISLPAGIAAMPMGRFCSYSLLGSALWNSLLIGAGYLLGSRYDEIDTILGPAGLAVFVILTLGYLWRVCRLRRARRLS